MNRCAIASRPLWIYTYGASSTAFRFLAEAHASRISPGTSPWPTARISTRLQVERISASSSVVSDESFSPEGRNGMAHVSLEQ